jgi:hypothetical protein
MASEVLCPEATEENWIQSEQWTITERSRDNWLLPEHWTLSVTLPALKLAVFMKKSKEF